MFEKIIFKDEKYRQIYEDVLLNTFDKKLARRYTIKQFLMDNYNSYMEINKKGKLTKRENNIYKIVLEDTLNKKNARKYKIRYVIQKKIETSFVLIGTVGVLTIVGVPCLYKYLANNQQNQVANNAIKYENEINEYNEQLEEYVNNLDLNGLTDLEIIMMVIYDMWKSIDGYQPPTLDVTGYHRLSINEEGVGQCRHMADHITAILNAINPDYNARNVIVYADADNINSADVNVRKTEEYSNQLEQEQGQQEQEETPEEKLAHIVYGAPNHVVTLVDIPGKDITLVIDSTNGQLGVLLNGKIKIFNDLKGIYNIIDRSNYIYYSEWYLKLISDRLKSFGYNESYEELEEQYGLDAQNEALEKIKDM